MMGAIPPISLYGLSAITPGAVVLKRKPSARELPIENVTGRSLSLRYSKITNIGWPRSGRAVETWKWPSTMASDCFIRLEWTARTLFRRLEPEGCPVGDDGARDFVFDERHPAGAAGGAV